MYHGFMGTHKAFVTRILKGALVIIAIALFLETFVFNYSHFASSGQNFISLNNRLTLQQTTDEQFKLTESDHVMVFNNLNTEVNSVRIDFDSSQPAQSLQVKIQFTDEAHQTYFDTTDYTVGIPVVTVVTNSDASEYINLNTTGLTDNLRIEVTGEKVNYPIKIHGVYLNQQHPFVFNGTRFALTLFVLALIAIFRPKSPIYRYYLAEHPVKSKVAIVAAVFIQVYLIATFLFFGSNLVGVATQNYNSGSWNPNSIVTSYDVSGGSSLQYAELAKAMAHGQLYLEVDPPQWLKDMSDPYDKGARDELQKQVGGTYLNDVAYYEGHYYVYFGVVPVFMFYLPFYVLTGANFPTAIGVLIACIAFVLGCSVLLDRFARYHFKRVSLGLYLLLQIPLVLCCGILYLIKFPTFYSLPIMLGLAFSVWGLYFWMRGRASERSCGWYLAGSLCMALVVGCRPQLVVLSLLAIPLFWRLFITERHILTKQGMREFACLLAPYFVIAALLMTYNYLRFGSLTDFGANYNLTVNDMTKRGFVAGRIPPAFFTYFLQPPTATGIFPFLQAAPFETTYMGQTIKEVTFGGIFACLPVLWVLPFAVRILKLRIQQRSTRTIAGVILVLLASGFLVALMDAEVAGLLQRYYADFSFMFLTAAVLLVFIANENLDPKTTTHQVLMKVLLVLVFLSVLYSVLLCFVPETGWVSEIYPWAYQDILQMVQFWR